jgi:hypothetical protein
LQTTVKAGGNIGLTTPDVFYFGNAPGESGNIVGDTAVSIIDELLARNNPASIANPAGITNRFDYNRDTRVSAIDQIIARNLITTKVTELKLFQTPASLVGGGLTAQSLQDDSNAASSDIARGLAVVSSSPTESSAAAGSSFTMSGSTTTKLRPQALTAVYSSLADEPSTRRASGQSGKDVDSDLLELLASGPRK